MSLNQNEIILLLHMWMVITNYVNGYNKFDSFGVEQIPKEIKKSVWNKNIITNIYRLQAYYSMIYGHFCIAFIDFMLKDESLLHYTNLFSPSKYKKNGKIILKYFQ